jgi:PTH1 family peptidyl-tRNA hydrolase
MRVQSDLLKTNYLQMKYLIAGLGNIGIEYQNTRHNIGFMVLDALAAKYNIQFELKKLAYITKWSHKGRQVYLIKPTTYMNRSGESIRYWLQTEKIEIENLLVINDDLAFDFGKVKLKPKGSAGGHNGLKDIELKLQTQNYARLRVGIGSNFAKGRQVEYVLGNFDATELIKLPEILEKCITTIEHFVTIGLERTMSVSN